MNIRLHAQQDIGCHIRIDDHTKTGDEPWEGSWKSKKSVSDTLGLVRPFDRRSADKLTQLTQPDQGKSETRGPASYIKTLL